MYPAQELKELAARKRTLRRDIALHRAQCATAAARLAQPVAWIDRMLASWRRLAPLAAVPLALLAARIVFPRQKILPTLVRWAPLAFNAARGLGATFLSRPRSSPS
ncbi:MAG: hypothetical protein JNK23_01815 [Opitutaceae bacterium]|nr:hypothetical protein [Opitutaceae bacterium]